MASNKKKSDDQTRKPLSNISTQNKNVPVIQTCDMHSFVKEHSFLAQLIRDDGVIFECDGEAPSPSKDYGQLQITMDKVILRWWKISIRNIEGSKYPGEIKDSYEDFYHDEVAQREIWRIFGQQTLDYCINLVRGKLDWLTRLPTNIQIHILSYLNLDDIPQTSLVSKSFRMLCRNNDLWQIFYVRYYGQHALDNRDLVHLAERRGWRHVFFTNRLKLQMQLRRQSQIDSHHPEDPSDFVKSRERRSILQPSPPTTPRQQQRTVQPSIRRHSFATRKEPPPLSPRALFLTEREESPRTPRSYTGNIDESSRILRPPSPSSSVRSNAGSVATSSSAQPPVHPPHRTTDRH